ncbi:MAG: glycosyltransferase [Alphaproteobacteria bacterium]|jgi:glycosyltransferase involved in cell wall biosynthesis|nr:glycosyltransferase [Alphaproteobacteria bacterium]
MKIAHIITGLDLGGAERQLQALVTTQDDPTLSHVVISLKDEGIIGKQLACQPGVHLYCLNLHKSFRGLWQLYKILRREKPDVVQTWLYHADLIGLIIGKLARVPYIVWNIRCSNMDLSKYSKSTGLVIKLLKYLSKFPNALIANSRAGQNFHTRLGYKPRQWVLIPNGIDTDLFHPNSFFRQEFRRSLKIPQNALVVGMLGRVDPMKDHKTFLVAMEHLSHINEDIYCLVAGKGTDDAPWQVTLPRLERLGMLENAPEFINALDIMVLSSAFGEGFPNVVGEAMACGIPTIVTDVGDAAALVQTPEQIVPPKNVGELIHALKRLLAHSTEERREIGQKSRERILKNFSLPTMRQRYALFYKSLR